jgi:ArsR family transcriptional regulator
MLTIEAPPVKLEKLAAWLKVLGEPKRLYIFHMIMEGVHCNCEFGDGLEVPPNLVSYHLRALQKAGLVDMQRDPIDARWIHYSVNCQALDELRQAFGEFFDPGRIKPPRPACGPQVVEGARNTITIQI